MHLEIFVLTRAEIPLYKSFMEILILGDRLQDNIGYT